MRPPARRSALIATGATSVAGSNGMKDMRCALMANGPGGATNSMWPSAGAFTTISTPILPFAPGRVSTTNGSPKLFVKSSASERARKSTEPPGGLVAMMRTVRLGQGCCAGAASGSAHAARNTRKQKIGRAFIYARIIPKHLIPSPSGRGSG